MKQNSNSKQRLFGRTGSPVAAAFPANATFARVGGDTGAVIQSDASRADGYLRRARLGAATAPLLRRCSVTA